MKKILITLFSLCLVFVLTACNTTDETEKPKEEQKNVENNNNSNDKTTSDNKSLVIYFSWSGNTKAVAQEIQQQMNADIYEVVPQVAYSTDYDEVINFAQKEQEDNARPEISGSIDNFDQYDTVFVGYPNWWGDMPMIMYTLFDEYDFSNKTIVPFVTSGGSGFSGTINAIKKAEPQANVLEGLSLSSNSAKNSSHDVETWLKKLNLLGE